MPTTIAKTIQQYRFEYNLITPGVGRSNWYYDSEGTLTETGSGPDQERPKTFTSVHDLEKEMIETLKGESFGNLSGPGAIYALVEIYHFDADGEAINDNPEYGPMVECKFDIDENAKAVNIQEVTHAQ